MHNNVTHNTSIRITELIRYIEKNKKGKKLTINFAESNSKFKFFKW